MLLAQQIVRVVPQGHGGNSLLPLLLMIVGAAVISAVAVYFIMREKVLSSESSKANAWGRMGEAEKAKMQASRERDEARKREADVNSELVRTKNTLSSLQKQLEESNEEIRILNNKNEELIEQSKRWQEKLQEIEALETELAAEREDKSRYETLWREEKQISKSLNEERDLLGKEVASLKQDINYYKKTEDEIKALNVNLAQQLQEADSKEKTLRDQIDLLNKEMYSLKEDLKKANYAFEAQKNVNEQMAIDKEKEIQKYKDDSEDWQRIAQEQEKDNKQLKSVVLQLETAVQANIGHKEEAELKLLDSQDSEANYLAEILHYQDYFGKSGKAATQEWNSWPLGHPEREKFKEKARELLGRQRKKEGSENDFSELLGGQ